MSTPHILVVDDEHDIRELISDILIDEGYQVSTAGNAEQAHQHYADDPLDLVLLDIWMPDADGISVLQTWQATQALLCPVVMMSGHGTVETAVQATRLGASDFIEKPIALARLLATVKQTLEQSKTDQDAIALPNNPLPPIAEPQGKSALRNDLRRQMRQLAEHPHHYSVVGASGTQKNGIAGWVHQHSNMADKPLLTYEDAEQLDNLIKHDKLCGSLILNAQYLPDLSHQNRLAQYIKEAAATDLRVVLLTELTPRALLEDELIGEPLYFAVSAAVLNLPSLNEHIEDVPDLIRYYTELLPDQESLPYRHMSLAGQNCLRQYTWPGNEQELINLIRQLLLLGSEGEITREEVEQVLANQSATAARYTGSSIFDQPLRQAREDFEREYLIYHLQRADGSVGAMAELVGMERTHLYRKLRGLGLDPKQISRSD